MRLFEGTATYGNRCRPVRNRNLSTQNEMGEIWKLRYNMVRAISESKACWIDNICHFGSSRHSVPEAGKAFDNHLVVDKEPVLCF